MFLILGGSMSLIVGLVGVLNVINTVLTGIVARRKELATLQAIGMTGKQLKNMLTCEGLLYTGGAAVVAVALNLLTVPMAGGIEKIFWFCEYKFTFVPSLVAVPVFAVVGILVPVITYAMLCKKSVVERLREGE
jgi:putative ABC transport system permease protein